MELHGDNLERIINHVILPPMLPQEEELEEERTDDLLLYLVNSQMTAFVSKLTASDKKAWEPLLGMISKWTKTIQNGILNETSLSEIIKKQEIGDFIGLHLKAQNAGMVIHRNKESSVVFHVWEGSPRNKDTLEAQGRLVRHFPGRSVSIQQELMEDQSFLPELIHHISSMHHEVIHRARSAKAGSYVDEERETIEPCFVTEQFMSILAALGVSIPVPIFVKCTRDDVLWKGAKAPWRRSVVWLVIRVAIQLSLSKIFGVNQGRLQYKNFALWMISGIARDALKATCPVSTLTLINAKMARRLAKLGKDAHEFVSSTVLVSANAIRGRIDAVWSEVQKRDARKISPLREGACEHDVALKLESSRQYLLGAMSRNLLEIPSHHFQFNESKRLCMLSTSLPDLKAVSNKEDAILQLADFEIWVERSLSAWILHSERSPKSCKALTALIGNYHREASKLYVDSAREFSLAILVIVELWIALDIMCVHLHPLLEQYNPGIPVDFLNPLLLPTADQMLRLQKIESYLRKRVSRAKSTESGIFADPSPNCFAVRFFDTSQDHSDMRKNIEDDAAKERQRRKAEWLLKKNEWEALQQKIRANPACVLYEPREGDPFHWRKRCPRCLAMKDARSLKITIHEWPLPENNIQAKAAVFELDIPQAFASWRDATWMIIQDIGRSGTVLGCQVYQATHEYNSLSKYATSTCWRVGLSSKTKSFLKSHYSEKKFPIEQFEDVCVNNGLNYQLRDTKAACWLTDQRQNPTVARLCMLRLPSGPYSNMTWTMDSTKHAPNEVIAKQHTCNSKLTIPEFIAFGSLRCGEKIQWYNIIRELDSSNLSFNEEAVLTLIAQTTWQAGSPGSEFRRESHMMLASTKFAQSLLEALQRRLLMIEASWKEQNTISVITILALRALHLSPMRTEFAALIRQVRKTLLSWCESLAASIRNSNVSDRNARNRNLLLKASCTCLITYDCDDIKFVLTDDEDIRCAVIASVFIHDNKPTDSSCLSSLMQCQVLRATKVNHAIECQMRHLVNQSGNGINKSLQYFWNGAEFSGKWRFLDDTLERWAINETVNDDYQESKQVHYNLLNGKLLVGGLAIGQVPKEIREEPLYRRIFGDRVLDVFASDMAGMTYSVSQEIGGHRIHIGHHSHQLLIRATSNGRTFEAIPPNVFIEDLPRHFVEDFVHWIDIDTGKVSFRPFNNVWNEATENWQLEFRQAAPCYLRHKNLRLLGQESSTAKYIVNILSVLDISFNIHVTLSDDGMTEVELPRLGLRFFLNRAGRLESQELGASVDDCQAIGSFIGLKSKLVLRSGSRDDLHERSILVPHGVVNVRAAENHVDVRIITDSLPVVKYSRYYLDYHLQKLRSPPDLYSGFFQAYIHAVTSFPLPDPFLGKTGTQEALESLREGSSWPCLALSAEEVGMLNNIANITPKRCFYPANRRVMQTVFWNKDLSPLVQHEEYLQLVNRIIRHNEKFVNFHPDLKSPVAIHPEDCHLQVRSQKRHAWFRGHELGGHDADGKDDSVYISRDTGGSSSRARCVFEIAALVKEWPSRLYVENRLEHLFKSWEQVSSFNLPFMVKSLTEMLYLHFPDRWGSLYDLCRLSTQSGNSYQLIFLFGTIAYGQQESIELLKTLLLFASSGGFSQQKAPEYQSYNLRKGREISKKEIIDVFQQHLVPFNAEDPSISCSSSSLSKKSKKILEKQRKYEIDVKNQTDGAADLVYNQWPVKAPCNPSDTEFPMIDLPAAMTACRALYAERYQNHEFHVFAQQLEKSLKGYLDSSTKVLWKGEVARDNDITQTRPSELVPSLHGLLRRLKAPVLGENSKPLAIMRPRQTNESDSKYLELESLIAALRARSGDIREKYGRNLEESLSALKKSSIATLPERIPLSIDDLIKNRQSHQSDVENIVKVLGKILNPSSDAQKVMKSAGIWPTITPRCLLRLLASQNQPVESEDWKRCLIVYAEAIALLQRSERMIKLFDAEDISEFCEEAENTGREGWCPLKYPDWLLLELENNMSIRRMQARVAIEMLRDDLVENSVCQLVMGAGKSSVIVPMAIAALANGKQLARLLVLKPLLPQTGSLLRQRLGEMLNRKVFHIPFHRGTYLNVDIVTRLQALYRECMRDASVLISLPEHVLSFRLRGIEAISKDCDLAKRLITTEYWLRRNCRDILDESDELLDAKFQLVYTVAGQKIMDGAPNRWLICQDILNRVKKQTGILCKSFPEEIEIYQKDGAFPRIRFLQKDLGQELVSQLVEDVFRGYVPSVQMNHCSLECRGAVRRYIQHLSVSARDRRIVEANFKGTNSMTAILVLRGLIANKILLYALQGKRWFVDYGLDLSRCLMAVPYRAKSVPSLNSEFGHPDVAILLTYLSYYYTGLTFEQLRMSFRLLLKEPDPANEYRRWHEDCVKLPANLRSLDAVNLEDNVLCDNQLFPRLQYSSQAANFYLSKVVFPKEAKEFEFKISTSSWDLPAAPDGRRSTGFSGTNDNRIHLPLSIIQNDLVELRHTNAMVLTKLLRQENRQYILFPNRGDNIRDLLDLVSKQSPEIRVLIDVGAQVLEMPNQDVAEIWLSLTNLPDAAVFYEPIHHLPWVVDRGGRSEKLQVSPFRLRLGSCLIYLDQAHTRGIDLPMPIGMKAAVTLGPRLTKDSLTQACMRMRKIGHGHSIAYFVPPDIHQKIVELTGKAKIEDLDAKDVIEWCIEQSCLVSKQITPLWAMQGLQYLRREESHKEFRSGTKDVQTALADKKRLNRFWTRIQEPEAKSLVEMYSAAATTFDASAYETLSLGPDLDKLLEAMRSEGESSLSTSKIMEEQEREVAHEIERERQIERPSEMSPSIHKLSLNIQKFVDKGFIPNDCPQSSIFPAFESLLSTSAAENLERAGQISAKLRVTADYANTVKLFRRAKGDDFLRPVHWVLTSNVSRDVIIISPFEADQLLRRIEKSPTVQLHMYSARVTKSMTSFANLKQIAGLGKAKEGLSDVLRDLNFFAGTVYFDSFQQYENLCSFLGIVISIDASYVKNAQICIDGFVDRENRKLLAWKTECPFQKSPLPFVKKLLAMRTHGNNIEKTDMGRILAGNILQEEDFEDVPPEENLGI